MAVRTRSARWIFGDRGRIAAGLFCGALLTICIAAATNAAPQAGELPLTGEIELEFALPGPDRLFMPTDVALGPDQTVWVVDGVNDRVVHFDADASYLEEIRQVGDLSLSVPLAATVDSAGRLWIADTGHQRVVVRGADGSLERVINFDESVISPAADISGLALSTDETTLWLVDNDHHRVLRYDLAGERVQSYGTQGRSLAEFHYPFSVALTAAGDALITDVLNGRIQALTPSGAPRGVVGAYGVELGQFYRPKGVAVGPDGTIWGSDGTLNVVQAFTIDGRLIDVLRDDRGAPFRFASPMGMATDASGALYVVELLNNRVIKLRVEQNANAIPANVRRRRALGTAPQPQSCTACHFEWMQPLADGRATELAGPPDNPPEHPAVSRSEMCLGCHDGSVGDSRRTVWVEHGHLRGITPPEGMTVPEKFPLVDGAIQCRTCHSAHASGQAGTDLATIFFLRIEESTNELCIGCHSDLTGGVAIGSHPLGEMPWPIPEELLAAGAHAEPDPRTLACQSCHTAHGALHERLQYVSPQSNNLCLPCHTQMTPGVYPGDLPNNHPLTPLGDPSVIAAAGEPFERVSADGQAICLSCHKMHHALPDRQLLTPAVDQAQLCITCHADLGGVAGSPHDAREMTALTAAERSGATTCSACHAFHRDPRPRAITAVDPTGVCLNCHQPDGLAAESVLGPNNHPTVACTECHNPHETRFGSFLARQPAESCRACHEEQATVQGGPHDIAQASNAWPSASTAMADECLACHRPHATAEETLFRVTATDAPPADASCLGCHSEAAAGAASKIALVHPREGKLLTADVDLPVLHMPDGSSEVACRTCHNPHGGMHTGEKFLRIEASESAEGLCLTCHQDKVNVHMIGHAAEQLEQLGFESGSCQPCHVTHSAIDLVESHALWRKSLTERLPDADVIPVADHYCFACHRAGGPVEPPEIAGHPDVPMYNPTAPGSAEFLPLFNERGEVDPSGTIACRTCHLTHGRETPAPISPNAAGMDEREARARQWHVRSFVSGNVCTSCHGYDALRRYLYFHTPERRGGPIETRATPRAPALGG